MEDDESYWRRRAVEEQLAAINATCAAARERHQELSDMCRLRAEISGAHPRCYARHVVPSPVQEVDLLAD